VTAGHRFAFDPPYPFRRNTLESVFGATRPPADADAPRIREESRMESSSQTVNLDAYFDRIEYAGPRKPTLETLTAIHLAHVTHIPFENLDVLLGRPIALDVASIQEKLIRNRRGGYCFEQNTYLGAALEQLGFQLTRLAARVRYGATRLLPRTHMLLQVDVEGHPWLADVGFGREGILEPIPMVFGSSVRQYHWTYRLAQEGSLWVLQLQKPTQWFDLYVFSLEQQHPPDFEVMNYYVSTHPESRFRRCLTVQHSSKEARYAIHNREFLVMEGHEVVAEPILDDELLPLLEERFGLRFPLGTRIPIPDDLLS
jgi:N-hydroxyarylamine O-acetyltransferase